MKTFHVITGLNRGGAETKLCRLLRSRPWEGIENVVVSLMDAGPLAAQLEAHSVRLYALGMQRGCFSVSAFRKLRHILMRERPDIVQTWMYHGNLIGGLCARLAGVRRVFWSIHHANLSPSYNKWKTLAVAAVCSALSRLIPTKIVFCSRRSAELHRKIGYSRRASIFIPNGFDMQEFRPSPEARRSLRDELGISDETLLIGLIARFDVLKDHATFCRAAALVRRNPHVRFLLAGPGITPDNEILVSWLQKAGVGGRTYLLGSRTDVPRLCAAIDILTLCSVGEAFPNIIGEAMACGVPCVVTAVGDCASIVGATGVVVPPGDPEALAAALLRMASWSADERQRLGSLARQRIADNFSLDAIAARYLAMYSGAPQAAPDIRC